MKKIEFYPPLENRFIQMMARGAVPFVARRFARLNKISFDPDGITRLNELKGKRVVLCPNHPTGLDPILLFCLSRTVDDSFYYLAALEVFSPRAKGWFLQRLGCYSIMRGAPDMESFRTTRKLLSDGKRWVVIFPEGEACGQNDTVIPFQQGVAQFGFWALEDLARSGSIPPLYFVPVCIKYRYLQNMSEEIARSLSRLEKALFDQKTMKDELSHYDRLRRIAEAIVSTAEKEYGLRPLKGASFEDRILAAKESLVARSAAMLGVTLRPEDPLLDRIRHLFNALHDILHEEIDGPSYARELRKNREMGLRHLYNDLTRALRFVATHDGYVRETLSDERFLEMIGRFEREVFGKEKMRGPREAFIHIGNPILLNDHFQHYKKEKKESLANVTSMVEDQVKEMLSHAPARRAAP